MKAIIKRVGNKTFFEMKLSGEETRLLIAMLRRSEKRETEFGGRIKLYRPGTYTLPLEMLMEEDGPVDFRRPKR